MSTSPRNKFAMIPIERLVPHPLNSNRMPERLMAKLKSHIGRTGLYEPIVVKCASSPKTEVRRRKTKDGTEKTECEIQHYQILNGHHRVRALKELGHATVRCDVWEVSDAEALVLLATLNRLEGKDDPTLRGRLIAELERAESLKALARKLPEPAALLERLRDLAHPVPELIAPQAIIELDIAPVVFYLASDEHRLVNAALGLAGGSDAAAAGANQHGRARKTNRAGALARIAKWYLESKGEM